MKKLILLLLITTLAFAQAPTKNANGFFAGTGTMNASAIGQFDSTSKGFLFPRMTTTQRNAIAFPATSLVIFNTTTSAYNYWNGTAWTTFGGGGVPTLQQVLDNNHDLVDGNNFQGTDAGLGNSGLNVIAFGSSAAYQNSEYNVNALGDSSAYDNTGGNLNAFGNGAASQNTGGNLNAFGNGAATANSGQNVNAFGFYAGYELAIANVFNNVNLFGFFASADADNQTVFSKWLTETTKYLGRLSFNNITADRKWELPNASGTIALTSDISNSIAPLETNSTDQTVWNNGKSNVSTNTSFGEKALKSNTTGMQSTAYGNQALEFNTTGELNSAFGANALASNTTGTRNTAVGSVALSLNTSGIKNTAVGQIALYSNTTGSNNTVIGQDALRSNTTASNNTAVGHEAMYANTTGADNTAVGKDVLYWNTTGADNTAIGGSALPYNTIGSGNTAIGRLAGMSLTGFNTNPTNSIYIGTNAYALAANQNNQIVIGENTTGAGSNTVTLGNSSITTTRLRGAVQGDSFVKDGGTSSQILMADGSVATAGSGISIASGSISASGGSATWGAITGTLSSQTDLQNALDLKADHSTTTKIIIKNITPSSALTGTTVETQITSFNFTIPANTFSATDILKVETIAWEKAGVANASSCRLKLSNTNNYAGASNVLILSASGGNINMRATRTYKIAGGNLKGFMSNSANGIFNDNILTNVAVSTLALNVTQPIFGFISITNTSSADSTIMNELIISKW